MGKFKLFYWLGQLLAAFVVLVLLMSAAEIIALYQSWFQTTTLYFVAGFVFASYWFEVVKKP